MLLDHLILYGALFFFGFALGFGMAMAIIISGKKSYRL